MKTGLFCTYENHFQSAYRSLAEQTELVRHAETLGFEEAWTTEYHFSDFHASPPNKSAMFCKRD